MKVDGASSVGCDEKARHSYMHDADHNMIGHLHVHGTKLSVNSRGKDEDC